jgi:putative component of membrane protein insertase Oxa1/YidC/SpoIIIJ protein YidD
MVFLPDCYAQRELIDFHYDQFDVKEKKTSYHQFTNTTNEAKQIFSAMFLFYKSFISSQDINVCVFTPSCSVYAMESIKKEGIFIGLLSAIDRLSRCHGFGNNYYPKHPVTHKNYDPVEKKE